MIIDISGTILVPGNMGKDCPGNGEHPDIACCCNECDYMLCCIGEETCDQCNDMACPKSPGCLPDKSTNPT